MTLGWAAAAVLVGFGEVGGPVGNPDVVQPELNGVGSADGLLRTMVSRSPKEYKILEESQ